jgi:hypothetical protein
MDYLNSNREWEMNDIHHDCYLIYYPLSNFSHCILRYTMNLKRFSSMYSSSVIIPAVGMHIIHLYLLAVVCKIELLPLSFYLNFSDFIDENIYIFNGP